MFISSISFWTLVLLMEKVMIIGCVLKAGVFVPLQNIKTSQENIVFQYSCTDVRVGP